MINISGLTDEQENKINSFIKGCNGSINASKNGNSLKLELELALYEVAGEEDFHKHLQYIHPKIDKIHSNIRITKEK